MVVTPISKIMPLMAALHSVVLSARQLAPLKHERGSKRDTRGGKGGLAARIGRVRPLRDES
jgi:hypothetical protein